MNFHIDKSFESLRNGVLDTISNFDSFEPAFGTGKRRQLQTNGADVFSRASIDLFEPVGGLNSFRATRYSLETPLRIERRNKI